MKDMVRPTIILEFYDLEYLRYIKIGSAKLKSCIVNE